MTDYSIWILEYAHIPSQARGSVLALAFNEGVYEVSFAFSALEGGKKKILVDLGYDQRNPVSLQMSQRDNAIGWKGPESVIKKIGWHPEDIDAVIFTHAHYDHLGSLKYFPKAQFYLQRRELMGWLWAIGLEKKYSRINMALNPEALCEAADLVAAGRMILLDGTVENLFDNISIYPAYDSHSFASQVVCVKQPDGENRVFTGDLAYLRENFTGQNNDGQYVPVGMGCGTTYNMMRDLDMILNLANGNLDNIVIGHLSDNFEYYPSWQDKDTLRVAEVHLASGQRSKIPN
jgi:glyoxylase-like metal-dependent hydrolase (beta-lactamase superfamily II)